MIVLILKSDFKYISRVVKFDIWIPFFKNLKFYQFDNLCLKKLNKNIAALNNFLQSFKIEKISIN